MRGLHQRLASKLRRWADQLDSEEVRHAKGIGVGLALYRCVMRVQLKNKLTTVIDVGANRGAWAQMIARLLPVADIHCFEPVPSCVEKLEQLRVVLPQLKIYPCALGDEIAIRSLNVNEFTPSSSLLSMTARHVELWPQTNRSEPTGVRVSTLDSEALKIEGRALLKLDVQGYELNVLRGAVQTLKNCELVICEVLFEELYENQTSVGKLIEFMHDQGFRVGEILNQHRTEPSQFIAYADLVFVPRLCQKSRS